MQPMWAGRYYHYAIINPWRMHEGYSSLCVCLSVTELTATYLVYMLKVGFSIRLSVLLSTYILCGLC